jgi:hypothetical protein
MVLTPSEAAMAVSHPEWSPWTLPTSKSRLETSKAQTLGKEVFMSVVLVALCILFQKKKIDRAPTRTM